MIRRASMQNNLGGAEKPQGAAIFKSPFIDRRFVIRRSLMF
jgi:hypothetical protein